jgi:hypothetical protein
MNDRDMQDLQNEVDELRGDLDRSQDVIYALITLLSPNATWGTTNVPLTSEESRDMIERLYDKG